jgi:glucokinase
MTMPTSSIVAGVDLGATHMQVGLVDESGTILARTTARTHADRGFDAVLDRITTQIDRMCDELAINRADLAATGVGAAGVMDPHTGVVRFAINLGWTDAPLTETLAAKLAMPVALENDVNAALLAEWKLGAAQGSDNALGVWLGTGVGGALILQGHLHYGGYLSGGEIGHTVVFPNAPVGQRTLEQTASRSAVIKELAHLIKQGRPSLLTQRTDDPADATSAHVAQAHAQGDPLVTEVIDDLVATLGVCLGNVVTLLSLDRIVIGGGLGEALGQPFCDRVQDAVGTVAFPDQCKAVRVAPSQLQENAGLLGAALRARDLIT